MAVFNSPFDLDDYEFRAVCAAWDIVQGGIALEGELMERFGRSVGFGVGVNCGPAVVGNIGCDFRMSPRRFVTNDTRLTPSSCTC